MYYLYLEQIKQAQTIQALDNIIEFASLDETLTATEYETLYAKALQKIQKGEW